MTDIEKKWLIWSNEHDAWWRPNHAGYTFKVVEAGLYSYAEALKITAQANLACGPIVDDTGLKGRPKETMVREDAYGYDSGNRDYEIKP